MVPVFRRRLGLGMIGRGPGPEWWRHGL